MQECECSTDLKLFEISVLFLGSHGHHRGSSSILRKDAATWKSCIRIPYPCYILDLLVIDICWLFTLANLLLKWIDGDIYFTFFKMVLVFYLFGLGIITANL